MKTYYLLLLFFSSLCCYAQKHAVFQLKNCRLTIHNAYGIYDTVPIKLDPEYIISRRTKNDTMYVELVNIFEQEIQGKSAKLTLNEADSFVVKQRGLIETLHSFEGEGWATYAPCQYYTTWEELKPIKKQHFRIKNYHSDNENNLKKLTPCKIDNLPLKEVKAVLLKEVKALWGNSDSSKEYSQYIRSVKKAEALLTYYLTAIEFHITLYLHGQKIGEQIVIFQYHYGC